MKAKKLKLIVKDTAKYGRGIFAGEDIKKGEVIHVLGGERISLRVLVKRVKAGSERIDDPLQIGCRTYLDMNEFSRCFNHSCNPNAGLRGESELFALQNIRRGKEITYDYSSTIAPTVWAMKCWCGSRMCRKIIGSVLTVPKPQLEKYKKLGALQDYMRRVLNRVERGVYTLPQYELAVLREMNKPHGTGSLPSVLRTLDKSLRAASRA